MSVATFLMAFTLSFATGAEFALPDVDAQLTPKNLAKLDKGKILKFRMEPIQVNGADAGGGFAVGVVDKPPADVWGYIIDYDKFTEFLPRITRNEVLERKDGEVLLRQTIKVLTRSVTYHIVQTVDHEAHTLQWKVDQTKENDIRESLGSWSVRPHGQGRSLVIYSILVDTGMRVPGWIESFLTRRDIPNVVKALKRRAESNGAYMR